MWLSSELAAGVPVTRRSTHAGTSCLSSTPSLLLPLPSPNSCRGSWGARLLLLSAGLGSCCASGPLPPPVANLDGCCGRGRGAGPPDADQLGTLTFSAVAAASRLAPLLDSAAALSRAPANAAMLSGPPLRLALPRLPPGGSPPDLGEGSASALNAGLCTTLKSAGGGGRALPVLEPPAAKAGVRGVEAADEAALNIAFVQVVAARGCPLPDGVATAVEASAACKPTARLVNDLAKRE